MVLLRNIIIGLLFSVTTFGQTTYYIDPAGSNGGTGAFDDPWQTLAYACTQVTTSGDIIHVYPGTYTETAQSELSLGVSIEGTDKSTCIITSSTTLNPILRVVSAAGNAQNGNQHVSGLTFDGNGTTALRAIDVYYRSNVTIEDCDFKDFLYNGVRWLGTTGAWNATPTNTLPTGNKLINCTFDNCTQYTGSGETGNVRLSGQSGFLWQRGSITQYNDDRGSGQNRNLWGGYQNYGLEIDSVTFTKDNDNGTEWNFFAELHFSHGGLYIHECTFNGAACMDVSGVVKGTYNYGAIIEDCTFSTTSSPASTTHDEPYLDFESFDLENDITVTRCHFNNSRTAIKINNTYTSAARIKINYNIFENVGNTTNAYSNAILIQSNWADTDPTPMREIDIQNNVMDAGQPSYSGILVSCWGDIDVLNLKNNIIYGGFGRPIRFTLNGGTPTIDSANISTNNFYGNTSTAIYYDGGVSFTNLIESGNITTDPLFTSSTDFSLQASSPCIDEGTNVGLSADYLGNFVPQNVVPDIGAYEHASIAPPPAGEAFKKSGNKFMKSGSGFLK